MALEVEIQGVAYALIYSNLVNIFLKMICRKSNRASCHRETTFGFFRRGNRVDTRRLCDILIEHVAGCSA